MITRNCGFLNSFRRGPGKPSATSQRIDNISKQSEKKLEKEETKQEFAKGNK